MVIFALLLLVTRFLIDDDEADTDTAEVPVRSLVATPRAKRIQPVGSDPAETNGPSPFSETVPNIPADSLAAAGGSLVTAGKSDAPANPLTRKPTETLAPSRADLLPVMAGIGEAVPSAPKEDIRTPPSQVPVAKDKTPGEPAKLPVPAPVADLPKTPVTSEEKFPVPVVVKMPAEPVQESKTSKPPEATGPVEPPKLPGLLKTNEPPKPVEPPKVNEPLKSDKPAAEKPLVLASAVELAPSTPSPKSSEPNATVMSESKPSSLPAATPASPGSVLPVVSGSAAVGESSTAPEKASGGLIALDRPAPAQVKTEVPATGPADLIDVKKPLPSPNHEKSAVPSGGLILSPAASDPKTELVTTPATATANPPPLTGVVKPVEPQEKTSVLPIASALPPSAETKEDTNKGSTRPRIFMPANLPAEPSPKPETAPAKLEPAPVNPPIVSGAAAQAVPAAPAALAKDKPVVASIPAAPILTAKQPTPPAPMGLPPVAEKPVEKKAEPVPPLPAPTAKTPVPEETKSPEAKKVEVPPPLPVPVARKEMPPEDGTPAAPLVEPSTLATMPPPLPAPAASTAPSAPATPSTPPKPLASVLPAASTALVAKPEPIFPVTNPATPPTNPVPASQPAFVSKPASIMATTDTTTTTPANARAAAQLTLGFEITSLQLTPFFKLGAVQIRPLSNIVSLHLVAAQATDNPLAAGISFQIVTVELDGDAHLKSLLLKPLPNAQQTATPSPKLQVDAVNITQAGEGAPITISSSDQTSTAVQLIANFAIAAMDFTPSFEIGSLRLEPTSNSVLLRLAPSQRPAALDLPPSFEVANVQMGGDAQITGMRLTPGTAALKGA